MRFDAYGWHTQSIENGNDIAAIAAAIEAAQKDTAALSDPGSHSHRLRQPEKAGQLFGAWQSAGRRGTAGDEEGPRLADDGEVFPAEGGRRPFPRSASQRRERATAVGKALRCISQGISRRSCRTRVYDRRQASRKLGLPTSRNGRRPTNRSRRARRGGPL